GRRSPRRWWTARRCESLAGGRAGLGEGGDPGPDLLGRRFPLGLGATESCEGHHCWNVCQSGKRWTLLARLVEPLVRVEQLIEPCERVVVEEDDALTARAIPNAGDAVPLDMHAQALRTGGISP